MATLTATITLTVTLQSPTHYGAQRNVGDAPLPATELASIAVESGEAIRLGVADFEATWESANLRRQIEAAAIAAAV